MVGNTIKFMRSKTKLKQDELAKKINISRSEIGHYETEFRAVSVETFKEIADVCDFEIIIKDNRDNKEYIFEDFLKLKDK